MDDKPTFTPGGTVTVNEDSGAYGNDTYATGITKGGGTDELGQTLTFTLTNNNTALFSAQPALTNTGRLTFTPAVNANGSALVTANLSDGTNTVQKTFTITVLPVNDQPAYTDIGETISVDEDCGAKTIAWVSGYSVGPANEAQTHTFSLDEISRTTYGNTSLFTAGPQINATTGAISFTPAANANGSVTYDVYLKDSGGTDRGGVDTSVVHPLTITVNEINDNPTFSALAKVTVSEDSGEYKNAVFATGVTPGGGTDEAGQELAFTLSGYDSALFTDSVTLSITGELIFQPKPDAHGSTTVNVRLSDGTKTTDGNFIIEVVSVNDMPSFTKGENQTVLEDCGKQTVSRWAKDLNKGAANESAQTLTFHVSNSNASLFTTGGQPALDAEGTLTYTPADDAFGTATVSVYLKDDGGTLNGGVDTSTTVTFTITVESVNDQPTFTDTGDITVMEDSSAYLSTWVTAGTVKVGPSNETQTFAFSMVEDEDERVTKGNTSLFSVEPFIDPVTGVIGFTPAQNANGSAVFTVYLKDPDGTDRGGLDTSAGHPLTITVSPDNDLPTITLGGNVTVNEDSIAYQNGTYATGIAPGGGTDEASQTLTIELTTDNNGLFSTQPKLTTAGKLTFTPAPDANGAATVTAALSDGIDTVYKSFSITVNAVNDKPAFTNAGNQTVMEDCGPQSITDWATSISKGPSNESGQTLTVTTECDTPGLFDGTTGAPSVSATGVLTFTPKADAFGSATVTVTFQDDGGTAYGGENTSETATFTITVLSVNDQPAFDDSGDISVDEDSGSHNRAWAEVSSIFIGPGNETQSFAFSMKENTAERITYGNTRLFIAEPAIDPNTGAISFTPASNANGSATFTVTLKDDDGTANGGINASAEHTLTITVNEMDDAPAFTLAGKVTVDEDSGTYRNNYYADNITPGGGTDESGQELTFTLTAAQPALFSEQPALTSDGKLSFKPAADAFGTTGVTAALFDGTNTTRDTFTIEILAINDQPVFTDAGNITVQEDSGAYAKAWAIVSSINAGPANETQACVFSMMETASARVTRGNTSLFSVEPAIDPATGAISFTPAENANGSATYTVVLKDPDGVENGGKDTSAPHTLVITVERVEDPPTITLAGNVTVNEDSAEYKDPAFATNLSTGGGTDEADETLRFTVTADDPLLFSVRPKITVGGELTFTLKPDAFGTANVAVTLSDGKVSVDRSFQITISAVNDQPVFEDFGDINVLEDCDAYEEPWANDATRSVGPDNEQQTYQYEMTKTEIAGGIALFAEAPAVDPLTGEISFTPAANAFGSAQVTVVLKDDDGTDNGGVDTSLEHTFTITVASVNDRPVFEDTGEIAVTEDSGAYAAVWTVPDTASAGPENEAQAYAYSMTLDDKTLVVRGNTDLFTVAPAIDESTGEISFTPAENASGTVTAVVLLKDGDGTENGGLDTSAEHTLVITVNAVNDVPSFKAGGDIYIGVGTGAFEQTGWATELLAGPADEVGSQKLTFTVTVDKPELFDIAPAIGADGTLTFTPSATQSGSTVAIITLSDDGGTEYGGVDTSGEQQITIHVVGSNELSLAGVITDARTDLPIAGAKVRLLDKDGDETAEMTVGDDGVYLFTGLTDSNDDVQIAVSAAGYQSRTVVTQVSFATEPSGTIIRDIMLSRFNLRISADPEIILGDGSSEAVITATVTDDTGEPIRGVTASFDCKAGTFKNGVNTATTGKDGTCSVTFISQKLSGTTELSIPITVVVYNDEKRLYGTAVILECFAPGFVEGIVTDGDHGNKPVEGAIVTVYKDFDGDGTVDFSETVITGHNGRYKIAVPRGDVEYNISITKPVTVNGTETHVKFEQKVHVGDISGSGGENTNPSKSAIGMITMQSEDGSATYCGDLIGSGLLMEIVGPGGSSPVALDPDTGVFSVSDLSEGSYTLIVYYEYEDGSRIIVSTKEITITSGGETNVSEVLIDPYGIVTDSVTGAPIEGATVRLYYTDTSRNAANGRTANTLVPLPGVASFPPSDNSNPQLSDSSGLYAFMVFPEADYYIVADKDGYETFTSGTISVGTSIVHYSFAMTPVEETVSSAKNQADPYSATETPVYFDPAVYVSTEYNRMLENGDLLCTVTFGCKARETLPAAVVQLRIPVGMTVQETDGGILLSHTVTWRLTHLLRRDPEWVESEFRHLILWPVTNLEPGVAYTRTVILNSAVIGKDMAEDARTLTADISTDALTVVPQDDMSVKTIAVASETIASEHRAYFPAVSGESFLPAEALTRGEAAAIFASLLGLDTQNIHTAYTDVQPGDANAGAIRAVSEAGYMKGAYLLEFRPDQQISRVEFISMVAKYLGVERSYYVEPLVYHFADIQYNWARSSIEEVYRYGVVTPDQDGLFSPYRMMTRGEATEILNRMQCIGALTNPGAFYSDVPADASYAGEIAAATVATRAMTNGDGTETAVEWLADGGTTAE